MRNTSNDLRRLLAIPEKDECTEVGKLENKTMVCQIMETQQSKKFTKALPNHRVNKELEKMLKLVSKISRL